MPPERVSAQGDKQRTVYVEHGVFYDTTTRNIHVTIPCASGSAHWSYGPQDAKYQIYQGIFKAENRWSADARE